ncbi:MAG: NHL repeat-containing protein [Phycisphaeraceae bacterium]|nr:NHL repeat-containing protein [Phycisphaeraceae bacterium]
MKLTIASVLVVLVAALAPTASADVQRGKVRSANTPLGFSTVTLYVAGNGEAASAPLGSDVADRNGHFAIHFQPPQNPDAVLYLIADGPHPTTRLATVLGSGTCPETVTINERTTIATAYAMAQFIDGAAIGGKWPGLQNAAGTLRNLVDVRNGTVGHVLGTPPNGNATSTMQTFNSLANLLAGAIRGGHFGALLFLATPPGGPPPADTLQAAVNIAHYPWQNPLALYLVSQAYQPYQPSRSHAPITWTLALKYTGNGHEFDGPGAMAFDARGDVWICNNYMFRHNRLLPTCGGRMVLKLTATGEDAPGAPFDGNPAGVDGVGFGITVDPEGNVWLGNFGFFGSTCPCRFAPPANSVSKLNAAGMPLSPPTGFTQGCIASPQSTVSDQKGSIWIANACGGSVTKYISGHPDTNWVYGIDSNSRLKPGMCPQTANSRPFGIAIDGSGNAWVTDNLNFTAFRLSPEGTRTALAGPETGINRPMGIAVDSHDGVWISNSGVVNMPCTYCDVGGAQDYGQLAPDLTSASITHLDSDGNFVGNYTGGGLWIPWGIAVDGNDNVWVANFGGFRVSGFNGSTGEPLSPLGFYSDALDRNTAVSIDPSGNVWLANNWRTIPIQINPGGDGMVVFIGLAAPVKTPLIGPPQRP